MTLVEILIAMMILVIGALGVANLQTVSLLSVNQSSHHFALDELSGEAIEFLRTHREQARLGDFNVKAEAVLSGSAFSARTVQQWRDRVTDALPSGESEIACDTHRCNVTISWLEAMDDTLQRQFFVVRSPL